MIDPFETAKRKIDRAEKRFLELQGAVERFEVGNAYKRVIEPHPDIPDREIHKLKLARDIKPELDTISDLVAEVAIALRSSLDNAGYAIAVAVGKGTKNCAFPFAPDLKDMPGSLGKSKDLPPEIQSLFCGFQPYKGGNVLLWAVNEICNADKHRITHPAITVFQNTGMAFTGNCYIETPQKPFWDDLKQEMILATVGTNAGRKFECQFDFRVFIAFGKIPGIEGKAILSVLYDMRRIVDSVLMGIEAEAYRLKFF